MIAACIISGIVLVFGLIVYFGALRNALKSRRPKPVPAQTTDADKDKPKDKKAEKKDEGGGLSVLAFIIALIVIGVMGWKLHDQSSSHVEWWLTWTLAPGHTDLYGRNSLPLSVEITKDDQDSYWAELHAKNGQGEDVKVGGLRLGKLGNNSMVGEWSNYLDGDGGKCYLYRTGENWYGHLEQKNGEHPDIKLEKKVSKL